MRPWEPRQEIKGRDREEQKPRDGVRLPRETEPRRGTHRPETQTRRKPERTPDTQRRPAATPATRGSTAGILR